MKAPRKGMINHLLVPAPNVFESPILILTVLIILWLATLSSRMTRHLDEHMVPRNHQGSELLIFCWLVSLKSQDIKVHWKTIKDPDTLYRHILQRNKEQLLKSINPPFSQGHLFEAVGRN